MSIGRRCSALTGARQMHEPGGTVIWLSGSWAGGVGAESGWRARRVVVIMRGSAGDGGLAIDFVKRVFGQR